LTFWTSLATGPLHLSVSELAKYDGHDPKLPIYLAVNGTIYDVSLGRSFYGPGGSYSMFAGHDGTRAFVTTCFEDMTSDLRGAELMFLPRDDPEIDKLYTSGELKKRKEMERRYAKKEVHKALEHWVTFFEGSPKYTRVGRLRVEEGEGEEGGKEPPRLCQKADEARPKRPKPESGEKGEAEKK